MKIFTKGEPCADLSGIIQRGELSKGGLKMHKYLLLLGTIVLAAAPGCGESTPIVEIVSIADNQTGTLSIKYTAREFEENEVDILAEYTTAEVLLGRATSKGGDGTTGISTSQEGIEHTFVWDYKTDLGVGRHRNITFIISPAGPDGWGRRGSVGPFHAGAPLLFTADQGADTVSFVDVGAGQVSSTAMVGDGPHGLVALPDESKLFVTNKVDSTVSIVEIGPASQVTSLAVGSSPTGIAVSPDGTRIYVTNSADGTVSVIDSSSTAPAVIDTYTVGATPVACSLTENGDTLFVANSGDDTVSVLRASDGFELLVTPVSVGTNPQGIASGKAYTVVCNYNSGTVSILEHSAIVPNPQQVAVESNPVAALVDAAGQFAYVANYGSNSISVINLEAGTVVGAVEVTGGPRGLTLDSKGEILYVTCFTTSNLSKIDVENLSVLTTFSVGANPVGVVILSE